MIYKFIVPLLVVTYSLFTNNISAEKPLEILNYELVKTVDSKNGKPAKYYKVSLNGPIKSTKGILTAKNMGGSTCDFPVFIEKDGTIWGSVEKKIPGIMGFDGGYGEKFELILSACDKNKTKIPLAKCEIIPFPFIIQDDEGHKIELKTVDRTGTAFELTGSGFVPKEQLIVKSRSCHESKTFPLEVNANGSFSMVCAPGVIGKTEGPFDFVFSGENMEPMSLQHYWGKIAFYTPNEYETLKDKYKFPNEL